MPTSRGRKSEGPGFEPSASLDALRARAELLSRIRSFFQARAVLEVETPALSRRAVTDVHLASFSTLYRGPGEDLGADPGAAPSAADGTEPIHGRPGLDREGLSLYLVTSPELAMKRLLAAGSGPIFQISRAFRNGERGRFHNPEFTLLEWYRPDFDAGALHDEVEALLAAVAGVVRCERRSYASLFTEVLELDPHRADLEAVQDAIRRIGLEAPPPDDVDEGLQLLFSHAIEPRLGAVDPVIVFDYPRGQAALARLRHGVPGEPVVAERFEVYWRGVELANGFHELADPVEQAARFERDREERRRRGLPAPRADERFLAALEAGLPDCSGIALGVDRLLMLILGAGSIDQALAFPLDRA